MENSTVPDYVIGYPLPAGEYRCDLQPEKETEPPPPPPPPMSQNVAVMDRSDSFPIPIKIEVESFNVSSLYLNLSPPSPSITADWSIALSGKNVNWKLTKSFEEVKAIVLYHKELVGEANVAPIQLRAGQNGAWRVTLTSSAAKERVKPWVVKNIAADRIRDDAVLFDFRLEGLDVRSSKKKHKLVYGCDDINFVFSANSSFGRGSFLYGPTSAIVQ